MEMIFLDYLVKQLL